jgi:hypothetical protein
MKSLEEIISYRNPRVIDKFQEDYYFDRDEAIEIFQELLYWLYLSSVVKGEETCSMFHSMHVMDKMWHTFLSFSRDYQLFCNEYLGRHVHHEPHTMKDAVQQLQNTPSPEDSYNALISDIAAFQELVYDELGKDRLIRWFVTYPHKYTPDEMRRRTRPQSSEMGFLLARRMKSMDKASLMAELSKSREVAAWCGGPNCGAMCVD